jgi:Sec7-like guanine-nucleotide exchange factor
LDLSKETFEAALKELYAVKVSEKLQLQKQVANLEQEVTLMYCNMFIINKLISQITCVPGAAVFHCVTNRR